MDENKTTPADDFFVPSSVNRKDVPKYVVDNTPSWDTREFVMHTDGSGAVNGCGGYAVLVTPLHEDGIDFATLNQKEDWPMHSTQVRFGSNYGETVHRNELTAMLEGLQCVINLKIDNNEVFSKAEVLDYSKRNKITISWFTDRASIANALLYDENEELLSKRSIDKDLWHRYTYYAQYVSVTPYLVPRNTIPGQSAADELCSGAYELMKEWKASLSGTSLESLYIKEKTTWPPKTIQRARF